MFLIDVAEWCINILVLSISFFFLSLGTFVFTLIFTVVKDAIARFFNNIT